MVMPAIQIHNLSKHFGLNKAVDNISFTVNKGEIFGFLGPNGAGKTTTIRMIMDFIQPTEGTVSVFEKNTQKKTVDVKKDIGYLSADTHLYNTWTGQEHIDFVRSQKGNSPLIEGLIQRLGFDPTVKVKKLSTGNKQKLNIILAFIGDPKLLILDEPTRGLDPLLQNEVYRILLEFKEKGGTVFLSSHNLAEVEHICNRVAIIRNGVIVAVENIQDLQGKNIHTGYVVFSDKVNIETLAVKNAHFTAVNEYQFSFTVTGNPSDFFHVLGKYEIKDFQMTHANLEDIFLTYYKN